MYFWGHSNEGNYFPVSAQIQIYQLQLCRQMLGHDFLWNIHQQATAWHNYLPVMQSTALLKFIPTSLCLVHRPVMRTVNHTSLCGQIVEHKWAGFKVTDLSTPRQPALALARYLLAGVCPCLRAFQLLKWQRSQATTSVYYEAESHLCNPGKEAHGKRWPSWSVPAPGILVGALNISGLPDRS